MSENDIDKIRSELKDAIAKALKDEEAASWLVERREVENLKERFSGKERPLALVSFDVDKIKDFVFASTKPLEIQGASEMVRELTPENRTEEDEPPECSIYAILVDFGLSHSNVLFAGGGTGLLIVPAESAPCMAKEIEKRFAQSTLIGSCTAVWRKFYPHELLAGFDIGSLDATKLPQNIALIGGAGSSTIHFGEIMRLLSDELREAKDAKISHLCPWMPGYLPRCDSCGVRHGAHIDKLRVDASEELLCASCFRKRKKGRYRRENLPADLKTAQSINEIAGDEGYVSVIYADANNMGQILFKIQQMEEYALFSRTITDFIADVIPFLVRKHTLRGRYQAPIMGGDDILLIVPAKKASAVASDLLEETKAHFKAKGEEIGGELGEQLKKVSMSLGFAIVPAHFAIRFAVDYAEALLRSAKTASYGSSNGNAFVDYMVIKDASPLGEKIRQIREFHYRHRYQYRAELELTRKPLSFSDFLELLEYKKLLCEAKVAKSQLAAIETMLHSDSPMVAFLNIAYQCIRTEEWRKFFDNIYSKRDVSREDFLRNFMLAEEEPNQYATSFIDLLELYDF